MVLYKLSDFMVSTELTHQHWNAQSFHISEFGVHGFEGADRWAFEMVAEDGFVSVEVASWSMGESAVEREVESYGLETNVCVIVLLPDSGDHIIIELLEFDPFCQTGQQKRRISDGVAHKRFIDEFIGYDIRVALESSSNFLPILHKLFVKMSPGIVEMVEDVSDIVAKVVFSPVCLIALVPIGFS